MGITRCGQIITNARCGKWYKWRGGKRNKRKIPPESSTETFEQPPPTILCTSLQSKAAATAELYSSSGREWNSRQPHVNIPRQPFPEGELLVKLPPWPHKNSRWLRKLLTRWELGGRSLNLPFCNRLHNKQKTTPSKPTDMICYSRSFQHEWT